MSGSLNLVQIIGHLGQDPEIVSSQAGRRFARLSVATSESWRDKQSGERREKTEWHRIVIFSEGLTGVAETYLRKGAKVYLAGALQTRKWQDPSGADRYSTEIVLQGFDAKLIMLDGRGERSGGGRDDGGYDRPPSSSARRASEAHQAPAPAGGDPLDLDDNIPF